MTAACAQRMLHDVCRVCGEKMPQTPPFRFGDCWGWDIMGKACNQPVSRLLGVMIAVQDNQGPLALMHPQGPIGSAEQA